MHYAKLASAGYKGGLGTVPTKGDFCCAKFTQDDTWYRVLVTAVEESDKGLYNVTKDNNCVRQTKNALLIQIEVKIVCNNVNYHK